MTVNCTSSRVECALGGAGLGEHGRGNTGEEHGDHGEQHGTGGTGERQLGDGLDVQDRLVGRVDLMEIVNGQSALAAVLAPLPSAEVRVSLPLVASG